MLRKLMITVPGAVPILVAVAILSVVGGPALAQMMPSISPFKKEEKKLTPEEIEKQKAADAAYNAAMQKIPEKKAGDPWGGIRDTPQASSPPPATAPTKTAKTKPPPQ
jgi:hypothetical protein